MPLRSERQTCSGASISAPAPAADVGSFEAHTRGIGARVLSRYGWTPGRGIGKKEDGRQQPIAAVELARSQGLGYRLRPNYPHQFSTQPCRSQQQSLNEQSSQELRGASFSVNSEENAAGGPSRPSRGGVGDVDRALARSVWSPENSMVFGGMLD
eukprot:5233005-Pleurochrysis_carterae.AAC.2